jgi:hypothetical protein
MTPTTPSAPHRWRRWLVRVAVLAVLLGVLMLYRDPGFMLMLADQVWACF